MRYSLLPWIHPGNRVGAHRFYLEDRRGALLYCLGAAAAAVSLVAGAAPAGYQGRFVDFPTSAADAAREAPAASFAEQERPLRDGSADRDRGGQ